MVRNPLNDCTPYQPPIKELLTLDVALCGEQLLRGTGIWLAFSELPVPQRGKGKCKTMASAGPHLNVVLGHIHREVADLAAAQETGNRPQREGVGSALKVCVGACSLQSSS